MKSKLLIIVLLFSSQINAQEKRAPIQNTTVKPQQKEHAKAEKPTELTAEQEAQINTINVDADRKVKEVQQNPNLSETEKKAELDKILKEQEDAKSNVINGLDVGTGESKSNEQQKANINTSRSNIKQRD